MIVNETAEAVVTHYHSDYRNEAPLLMTMLSV